MQRKRLNTNERTLREPFKPIRRQLRKQSATPVERSRLSPILLPVIVALLCLVVGPILYFTIYRTDPTQVGDTALEVELVPIEGQSDALSEEIVSSGLIELSGDPILILPRKRVASRVSRKLLDDEGAKNLSANGEIFILNDRLFASESILKTALPANQQNFAFYAAANAGAQLNGGKAGDSTQQETLPSLPSETTTQYHQTESLNTTDQPTGSPERLQQQFGQYGSTSMTLISRLDDGRPSRIEEKTKILHETPIEEFLTQRGILADDAALLAETIKQAHRLETLSKGLIVAYRAIKTAPPDFSYILTQISIYGIFGHIGTLARADNGQYTPGEDPWFGEELHLSREEADPVSPSSVRLLDGIYGSAVRNNVPIQVVGEAILLLSKAHNLEVPASSSDKLQIVYSHSPRSTETGLGKVLFVRISASSGAIECYVVQRKKTQFECVSGNGEVTKITGMVTPVKGVLTSKFGPRKHPILKKVRLHKGVDWAAPLGTPVVAAFAGVVKYSGVKGNYGNFIRLEHSDGTGTGYAHLQGFAEDLRGGIRVNAGQLIGYVGSTGLSTGPHLHFELYRDGRAQDPFGEYTRAVQGGDAVDTLVNRIIRVESAGNPKAKNPLSTATGLGQFIESTWMRMIRLHRPDVLKGRTRAQVLALRTDPTLAREMTTALAQGNANRLRANGQPVTPGNLYLSHFLGSEGAVIALRAEPSKPLSGLFNAGVIKANPFLRGKTADWVVRWAARKMRQKGSSRRAAKRHKIIVSSDPVFLKYRATIDAIL